MRILILISYLLFAATSLAEPPKFLDQGWNQRQREEFYFTAQGSHLIPYKWFLNLERHDSEKPFRSIENIGKYGFLPAPVSNRNPDGLPVGFVRDGVDPAAEQLESLNFEAVEIIRDSTRFSVKQALLGNEFDEKLYPVEREAWLGLTCAACHTHEIEYAGNTIRIDGGSSQADIGSLLHDLGLALQETHTNEEKLKRFAANLGRSPSSLDDFGKEVKQISDAINRMIARDKPTHPYGYARLDAFGAILNAVCETALGLPDNNREANAPVSYPSLWNTPQMGYVQWGATIAFAEARNVGEVLGVFGHFNIKPGLKQFESTVRLRNLIELEHRSIDALRSPSWPEAYLGEIDREQAAQGQVLFEKNCQSCHGVRDDQGEFALNSAGRIPITSNTVEEVKTDPQFLKNLRTVAETGPLASLLGNKPQARRTSILGVAVGGILNQRAQVEDIDLDEWEPKDQDPPHPNGSGSGYISRPLEGIWATAPYFHNGSVPNLYETLLPSAERSKFFWIGSRKFDPVKVGFSTAPSPLGSLFRVADDSGSAIVGNSNSGHEGHGQNEKEGFTQTFENGAWRDFTDTERYALVEYMKSLSSNVPYEQVPEGEAAQIDNIVDVMSKLMRRRYASNKRMLRGVHPKAHGCVKAKFEVLHSIPSEYEVGIFRAGTTYDAYVRFSNASGIVGPDSTKDKEGNAVHGSRGMAIKLLGVRGQPLDSVHGGLTQDFVMVNQPAFAFANVEDYELLNQVLLRDNESAQGFFAERFSPGSTPQQQARAKRTGEIAQRIRAKDKEANAFFEPPASPLDNPYFSAAPFRFGRERVMKFRATPVSRSNVAPNIEDPDYLENALQSRLAHGAVQFDFEIQVRTRKQIDVANDIENASTEWKDEFVKVARLTIPPQEIDSPELRLECERLFFTPWHGITDHEPLGGINRLRKAVYQASAELRNLPKEAGAKK